MSVLFLGLRSYPVNKNLTLLYRQAGRHTHGGGEREGGSHCIRRIEVTGYQE